MSRDVVFHENVFPFAEENQDLASNYVPHMTCEDDKVGGDDEVSEDDEARG